MYSILTTDKLIKHSVRLLLSHFRQLVSPLTPAVVSLHIWTPFSTAPLFNLGNILVEPFAMYIGHNSHVFWEKNPDGNAENEVSMTSHTP